MHQKQLLKWIIIILILGVLGAVLFTSCNARSDVPNSMIETTSSTPINDEDQALQTLTDFLSLLQSKDYASAEPLYGGSYDMLIGYNPDLDPADHVQLLERACEVNGLNCLRLKNASLDQITDNAEFIFTVTLQTDDGALFEIGPCCGEDEQGFIPVSTFIFTVVKIDHDHFQVMDLPPYTP